MQQANAGLLTMDSREDKAAHHVEQRVPRLPTYNKIVASSHASQQTPEIIINGLTSFF